MGVALATIGLDLIGFAIPGVTGLGKGFKASLNMTQKGLKHVFDFHTRHNAVHLTNSPVLKSYFYSKNEIPILIQRAAHDTPIPQPKGKNFERVVNAGRVIGYDKVSGLPTTVYTVITNLAGDLITAFPGRPVR